jgi:hypothetical protein
MAQEYNMFSREYSRRLCRLTMGSVISGYEAILRSRNASRPQNRGDGW